VGVNKGLIAWSRRDIGNRAPAYLKKEEEWEGTGTGGRGATRDAKNFKLLLGLPVWSQESLPGESG